MSEQNKRDAELRQIVTDALVSMVSGVTGLVPPTGAGQIPGFIQAAIDRAVEKISGSLPVGVPDGYALVPVEPTPEIRQAIDLLCDDHRAFDDSDAFWQYLLDSAPAAPTVKAEQVELDPSHRALIRNAINLLRIRRPVAPDVERVAADLELMLAGHVTPADKPSADWLEVAALAEAPALPAAGSAVEEVEVVAYLHERSGAVATADNVRVMEEGSVSSGYTIRLMTVAQHERIVAALSAQQSAHASAPAAGSAVPALESWVEFADALGLELRMSDALWENARKLYYQLRSALSAQQYAPSTVTRDQIRDVFMRNGFTVKEGQTDLKPYVYAAAQELLALANTRQSEHVSVPTMADVDRYRIELLPEHDAGYVAKAYVEESEPVAEASGFTAVEAVRAVIALLNGGEA